MSAEQNRVAIDFLLVERLDDVLNDLQQMLLEDEWGALMAKFKLSTVQKGNCFRRYICVDGFLTCCDNFSVMVEAVLETLCVNNGNQLVMGLVWKVMYGFKKPY